MWLPILFLYYFPFWHTTGQKIFICLTSNSIFGKSIVGRYTSQRCTSQGLLYKCIKYLWLKYFFPINRLSAYSPLSFFFFQLSKRIPSRITTVNTSKSDQKNTHFSSFNRNCWVVLYVHYLLVKVFTIKISVWQKQHKMLRGI